MKGDMNTPPIRQLNYAQHYFCPNITGVGLLSISYRRTERTIWPRFAAGTAPGQSLKSCIIRPNNHVNVRKNGTSRQTNRQTDGQTKVLYFPLWRCQRNNVHWKKIIRFFTYFSLHLCTTDRHDYCVVAAAADRILSERWQSVNDWWWRNLSWR